MDTWLRLEVCMHADVWIRYGPFPYSTSLYSIIVGNSSLPYFWKNAQKGFPFLIERECNNEHRSFYLSVLMSIFS